MSMLSATDWISALTAFFSAIAAVSAAFAIYFSAKSSREGRASDAVKKYLELAIQFPNLSTESKHRAQQRYEWFVSFVLIMAQEVLLAHPNDKNWKRQVRKQIEFNREELLVWKKDDPLVFSDYGTEVAKLVDEVLDPKWKVAS